MHLTPCPFYSENSLNNTSVLGCIMSTIIRSTGRHKWLSCYWFIWRHLPKSTMKTNHTVLYFFFTTTYRNIMVHPSPISTHFFFSSSFLFLLLFFPPPLCSQTGLTGGCVFSPPSRWPGRQVTHLMWTPAWTYDFIRTPHSDNGGKNLSFRVMMGKGKGVKETNKLLSSDLSLNVRSRSVLHPKRCKWLASWAN